MSEIDEVSVSDIIDIRPRVSSYNVEENSRSPFEFLSKSFSNNSSRYVFASDESFNISYSYYLPRIDRVFLSKDGVFQISKGEANEVPSLPPNILNAIEVATVELPAYLCNIDEANITLRQYKRYTMSDIESLENRISNLEYYTTLSLLEVEASSIEVRDATTGLNRFKSGFYVDDFSTTSGQKKVTLLKNFIDIENSSLRPAAHTTEIDLIMGTQSGLGVGEIAFAANDFRFDNNLLTDGLRRTGQLLTLDYEEVEEIVQDKSTKVVDVSAYSSSFFGGSVELYPSSDIWIDQVTVSMRLVAVQTGEVLLTAEATKTIASHKTGADVFRFLDMSTMAFEVESGVASNEPVNYAVRTAIEFCLLEILKLGDKDGLWKIKYY